MSDPRELYQQVIIEHNKKPRNFGKLEPCTHHAHGLNPLCGDDIEITLVIENGIVQDLKFQGHGCAISQASSSLMTTNVKGKPVEEAEQMVEEFRAMIRGSLDPTKDPNILGRLSLFQGVRDLPSRVKCAVLPWATLHSAIKGEDVTSTE
ncbi:Fe-S cluster assembly sulfur transfer protein SufU [Holophaga foetida]|uniref:Fe-S cluster assembly sulfur transfer protein SufU n=1 Tax=Holophaga foetida TaxID=35839 RepID=UPI000247335D|nr:SUF system NifU family Fe-S cluster assembly protein [Holophaga foetida]